MNATQFLYSTNNFNHNTKFHCETRSLSQIHATFSRFPWSPLALRHWGHRISTFCRWHFQKIFKNPNENDIIYQKLIPSRGLFCVYCGQKVNNSNYCYTIPHQNPHSFHHKRFRLNFHHHHNYKPAICLAQNTGDTTRSSIRYIRRGLIIGNSTVTFPQNILNM